MADRAQIQAWVKRNPLRAWRKSVGINFRAAAAGMGHAASSVMFWERGKFRPKAEHMADIAALIGKRQIEVECLWTDWLKQRPQ